MAENASVGLPVRIELKEGREDEVEQFLRQGRSLVQDEPGTCARSRSVSAPRSFGIFDAFPDDSARQAHPSGQVAAALGENTGVLFDEPRIEQLDMIAEKPPA